MSDPQFIARIAEKLQAKFKFENKSSEWWRKGRCPECKNKSIWCAAERPFVVKCDHATNCRYEKTVKELFPEDFEDWSKRAPKTAENPNATAEAYLTEERGIKLDGLRGHFSQEHYHDYERKIGSATVRFPLPGGAYWERLIDRVGRFDKKAHFKADASYGGHCWMHPLDTIVTLAGLDQIWLAEGIFNAAILRQNFPAGDARQKIPLRGAVSTMSAYNYPKHFLAELVTACAAIGRKDRPDIVFAYDVGPVGVEETRKAVARAAADGWPAKAAQVWPDGKGPDLDWNDLGLRHRDWRGLPEKAPFSAENLDEYLWNGAVTIERSAAKKARLLFDHNSIRAFPMRHDNQYFWVTAHTELDDDGKAKGVKLEHKRIADCAFTLLYRENDEYHNVYRYFLKIEHPDSMPTEIQPFASAAISSAAAFKQRLWDFAGMWSGEQKQLDRIVSDQKRDLRHVIPLHFTGYTADHKAWVLGDWAVHDGQLKKPNPLGYFDIGKVGLKVSSLERPLKHIRYNSDQLDFSWIDDLWLTTGPRAFVTLAFFTMSLFATQIRARQESLGFLEITGEGGSGKTYLLIFLWKLFGRTNYEGLVPDKLTPANLGRNLSKFSNLPIGLVEGKRDDTKANQRQFDWTELLTLYNGRSPRGTATITNRSDTFEPPFLGALYLCQNERIDSIDPVLQRLMSFRIDIGNRTPESQEAANRIKAWEAERASCYIVHVLRQADAWLKFYFARYKHHLADMSKRVKDLHNDRCIHNHAQLAASVECLGELLPFSKARIAQTLTFVDAMALDRQQSSGADHPLVQRFWEQVDYLASIEKLNTERPINLHRKPEELIAISIPNYEEKCRAHGQQPVDSVQLHKLLPGSKRRKFIDRRMVNCIDGKPRHCWQFEADRAAATPDNVL